MGDVEVYAVTHLQTTLREDVRPSALLDGLRNRGGSRLGQHEGFRLTRAERK